MDRENIVINVMFKLGHLRGGQIKKIGEELDDIKDRKFVLNLNSN